MDIPSNYLNIYTTPGQAEQINNIIFKYIPCNSVITDATAGIGGNTLYFCKHFKSVNVIEVNNDLENTLKYNLINYNNKLMYFVSYNVIKFLLKQDIIFIDPPWGGSDYKTKKKVNLYLDNVNVLDIIEQMYNYTKIICLKVPNNFNTYIQSNFWNICIHNITKSKKCIYKLIIFHKPI